MDRRTFLAATGGTMLTGPLVAESIVRTVPMVTKDVRPGVDTLLSSPEQLARFKGKKVGLITNQAGITRTRQHDIEALRWAGIHLVALFSPEHGLRGEAQAGDKVDSTIDFASRLPIHSLYGATKQPTSEMLRGIDWLLFDLQDVGARFYTYPSTLMMVLRAATKHKIPVTILDRPNLPGGELIEGPVLQSPLASFVGIFAMPVLHGMTIGELGRMFAAAEKLTVKLDVVRCTNWQRESGFLSEHDFPWMPPSPNLRSDKAVWTYAGTALFEGTNISEGRGSDKPFEYVGAPFIDSAKLIALLEAQKLAGVAFTPIDFMPTMSKFAGELCHGVRVIMTDGKTFRPFRTGVAIVKAVHDLYPDQFGFRSGAPSYFDQLAGVSWLREDIIAEKSLDEMEAKWTADVDAFRARREPFLLY